MTKPKRREAPAGEPVGGPRWRYQPVTDTDAHGQLVYLITIWVDAEERLLEWTVRRERDPDTGELAPGMPCEYPAGESLNSLSADLMRMYIAAWAWEPVAYDSLKPGMTFRRLISREDRASLAAYFDDARERLREAQVRMLREQAGPAETGTRH